MCHNREYSFFFEATSNELSAAKQIPKLIDLRPEPLRNLLSRWLVIESPKNIFYRKMV